MKLIISFYLKEWIMTFNLKFFEVTEIFFFFLVGFLNHRANV